MRVIFKNKMREELCVRRFLLWRQHKSIHTSVFLSFSTWKKERIPCSHFHLFFSTCAACAGPLVVSLSAQLGQRSIHSFPNSTCCLFTSGLAEEEEEGLFFFFRGPHLLILSFSFPFFLGLYLPAGRRFLFKGKTGAAIVRKKKKKKRKRDKKKVRKVKLIITLTRSLIYIAQRTGISCR